MSPILEVRNLATGYRDIRVVWDLSLAVEPASVTVLLGRNGAGKTTSLRAIAGLNPAPPGSVLYDGHDVSRLAPHKRARNGLVYVPEGKRVFKSRTVEENLLIGGYATGKPLRRLGGDVEAAYDRFPVLAQRRRLTAASLSGGQQQMLVIAQALMSEPRVLLLDEPSGGLAPTILADVLDVIDGLRNDGLAVLLVEQAVEFSLTIADRVVLMDLGRTTYDGTVDAPDLEEAIDRAFFGSITAGTGETVQDASS